MAIEQAMAHSNSHYYHINDLNLTCFLNELLTVAWDEVVNSHELEKASDQFCCIFMSKFQQVFQKIRLKGRSRVNSGERMSDKLLAAIKEKKTGWCTNLRGKQLWKILINIRQLINQFNFNFKSLCWH